MMRVPSNAWACPHCDVLHRSVGLSRYEIALCSVCGRVLDRYSSLSVDQLLAIAVTTAVLFMIANAYPLMTIDIAGMHTEATLWGTALLLLHGWNAWPAAVLAVTMFLLPFMQIAVLLWVLTLARFGRPVPGLRGLLVALHRSRPWSMTEVSLLGALVALVKLSSWLHVSPGTGLWALTCLTFLLTIITRIEPRSWWSILSAPT